METVLVYFVVIVGNLVSAGVKADINCGPPPVVRRAIIIVGADKDVYRPESLLLYKCQAGYFSDVTVVSSKCKLSGNIAEWTRPNIQCRRVTCDVPRSPKNGRAIYSSITYQAEVTYECNEGYYLSNQQRRFCSADKTWNGTEPVCSDNLCSLPRAPENGFFNLMSLKPEIGSTVAYSCKNGFKLEGSATSECTETRRWTNSIPRCLRLPKMCEPPVAPENGLFNLTPDKPEAGSTVKYSCKDGFKLHGSATSECSEEGTWTNPAPRCFFITDSCKVPEVLPHGEIGMYKVVPHPQYVYFLKYENISAGTIVADGQFVLKCEGTYKPRGSGGQEKRIECRDGTWLDELQCVSENSCELPVIPENVFYLAPEKLEFGSFIRYYCKDGFRLQGSAESVCRTTGRWSQLPPTCLTVRKFFEEEGNRTTTTQPSIRSSTEGKINVNGTKPDNKLCYCEYNNPDEHLVAYCEYIKLHNRDKVKSNCTVKFFCKEAEYYRLRGPREITCTNCQPFHWTQYPKCMERNRREPCFIEALFSRLPEGVMLKTEERQPETVPYGTTLELTCASNDDTMKHITNFSPMATCNGTWVVPRVLCYRPCRLTLRANSTLIVVPKKDLYLFGQAAMFSCPKGQTLTPEIRVMMCLIRGWSANPIPHCEDRLYRWMWPEAITTLKCVNIALVWVVSRSVM